MRQPVKILLCVVSILLVVASAGCRKKTPVAASIPPPPPPPTAPEPVKPNPPIISRFSLEPDRIEKGHSSILRWEVRDATGVQIDNSLGAVAASGERSVSPSASTTYTLTATGPGGSASAAATLTVTLPPPPVRTEVPPTPSFSERLSNEIQDVHFDFDKYNLRDDAISALNSDAEALKVIFKDFPSVTVVLEGHCDERGSAEYNLGLGDRRSTSVKEYLEQLGIAAERLISISYGKERPQCTEANEECWQKNRRVHFAPGESQKTTTSEMEDPETGLGPRS
jgi:peptidoglycan-associated lipoprotein